MTTPSTLSEFDYSLPPEQIARYPLEQRDHSKMLHVDQQTGACRDYHFYDLPTLLRPGDLVIVNNAKVMPARLLGHRAGHHGQVEIFLLHPLNEPKTEWQVLMRPARKLPVGTQIHFEQSDLQIEVKDRLEDGRGIVSLSWPEGTFDAVLNQTGVLPLPPYFEREAEQEDYDRYQTIFASVLGAQASPTAGLHFTEAVKTALYQKNIQIAEVTLHVSAGTFRPVIAESIAEHKMDPEYYEMSEHTVRQIEDTKARENKVVAIGTTSAKTLESAYLAGKGKLAAGARASDLFITPGFQFQVVDTLVTNFHLPKSTLLMLVSAFSSREIMMTAYAHAIQNHYRFYSYGDCMLIE
jgi:S-adenosylmethionine:tRNA ribosyltransferase-isomerase